ncbi:MAG: winged helix-turn-helix transcriptional regulator [Candidatus Lokiarchaeota archaeon]|nr:winged helix-turn-helix transcriptional regulator [Candidatus Harpocratesius repetitus]
MKFPTKNKASTAVLCFCLAGLAAYGGTRRRYGRDFKKEDILDQGTRSAIYETILKNPGLHFRRICRALEKKMGVVQYHVSVLEKNGLIRSIRDGRYKCFFAEESNDTLSPDERPSDEMLALRESIITSLRRRTPQLLISYLAKENTASHQILSNIANVSPQAITFHTQKLQKEGIIESEKQGRQKFYSLSEQARKITESLIKAN